MHQEGLKKCTNEKEDCRNFLNQQLLSIKAWYGIKSIQVKYIFTAFFLADDVNLKF